ncbi:hypothetical protein Q4S45_12990 [Massilia sp. R2A-15]|uniref:DUF6932 family protein n=1 Tax=Massilia sp. R2A-15 TaxID=3064278 RepID=UPI0027355E55|nr:hypothetical protein [Massilia sp. R2A-15]WLI87657.1 hypothetical protein Q4S45_12990 [Massilia sp. R2A-15]
MPDIATMFVRPFPGSRRRRMLAAGLTEFLNELAQTGVKCDVWIVGSFACAALDPADVDLLVVWNHASAASLDEQGLAQFAMLLDRRHCRTSYHCDVYQVPNTRIAMLSYWLGWFGFTRDGGTPQGIGFILV